MIRGLILILKYQIWSHICSWKTNKQFFWTLNKNFQKITSRRTKTFWIESARVIVFRGDDADQKNQYKPVSEIGLPPVFVCSHLGSEKIDENTWKMSKNILLF